MTWTSVVAFSRAARKRAWCWRGCYSIRQTSWCWTTRKAAAAERKRNLTRGLILLDEPSLGVLHSGLMRWLSPFVLMISLGACASLQSVSSGQVGCPESEVTISDDKPGWGTRTWIAECRGKRYFCSAHGGGENSTAQVSCKEDNRDATETASAASTASAAKAASKDAAPPGCQFDTQCKGDRVCVSGVCSEAPVSGAALAPTKTDTEGTAETSPSDKPAASP